MNIRDLIDQLEDLANEHGEHIEVRIAQQPNWPFENEISSLVAVDINNDEDDEDDDEDANPAEVIVYIGEGHQIGYLPGVAANELGWGR